MNMLLELGSDNPGPTWLAEIAERMGLILDRQVDLPGGRSMWVARNRQI